MAEKVVGVLLDTTGIQRYIFSSNRLKENLGASHLVGSVYEKELKDALRSTLEVEPDLKLWREQPDLVQMILQSQIPFEVGYIGGGNALLFFRSRDTAERFVQTWTKRLIINAPGLTSAVAMDEFDLDQYVQERDKLFSQLDENKNRFFTSTALPKHGITADCPLSGLSGEVPWREPGEETWHNISLVAYAKLNAAAQANEQLAAKYAHILGDEFAFTNEIAKLGQTEGHDYLAVVHIDGNGIGRRFKNCTDLPATRRLSSEVDRITSQAYGELLHSIIAQLDKLPKPEFDIQKDTEGKTLLPIRSIVLDGDDITFVTDGRLGVYLAEKFIHHAGKFELCDGKPLHFCAGVAIMKTRYPFFRGYGLAVELCAAAKEEAEKWRQDSSWLDFHIILGGKSGRLMNVREKHFCVADGGSLVFGPYLLEEVEEDKSIIYLRRGISELHRKWPRSKIKELREVLIQGKLATEAYIKRMEARGLSLPEVPGDYTLAGWQAATPYYSMVELLEFYPAELLDEEGGLA